jgi:hypothetical protein
MGKQQSLVCYHNYFLGLVQKADLFRIVFSKMGEVRSVSLRPFLLVVLFSPFLSG